YYVCSESQWQLHFDRMFPPSTTHAAETAGSQNYRKCMYYNSYLALATEVSGKSLGRIWHALKMEFNELAWVPYTQPDHMWLIKKMPGTGWTVLPAG
ncbi:hypothetical protein DFH29DRAFT_782398, partial [Suillus ampliporus]